MTYELRVNTENYTKDVLRTADLITAHGSKEGFLSELCPKIEQEIASRVSSEFAGHGYTVSVTNFYFNAVWEDSRRFLVDRWIDVTKLTLKVDYSIYSEVPIAESPLPVWVVPFVTKVIVIAVVAILGYFAIQAIISWLKSMTTRETTTWVYDEEGNLVEKITKTEPDIGGMSMIFVFLIVIVILAMFWQGRGR